MKEKGTMEVKEKEAYTTSNNRNKKLLEVTLEMQQLYVFFLK